jgi:predicted NBD/HSP70 family sugar kinase
MRRGTNLPWVRDYNRGVVLEAIRLGGGVSRVEIAQKTGLTAQTVSNIVRRFLVEGLVVEGDRLATGRQRVPLHVNREARSAVGVLIDVEETSFVILDLGGCVVLRRRCRTDWEQGTLKVIQQIAEDAGALLDEAGVDREKVLGIGVACPGPLDHQTGVVFNPPNLPGWDRVPLSDALSEITGYPVIVDNDATAAAIGERWSGGARGARNFAFVYVSAGIGAGLFLEDHVFRGATTNAGEFGHITLNPDGPPCHCGNRGCVEAYCAPSRIVAAVDGRIREGEVSTLSADGGFGFADVCRAALAGDAVAGGELRLAASRLGCGVVSLVNLLDVELVVLGGTGLGPVAAIFRQEIERELATRAMAPDLRPIRVELSQAGEDAAAVGAASLVMHTAFAPRQAGLERAHPSPRAKAQSPGGPFAVELTQRYRS